MFPLHVVNPRRFDYLRAPADIPKEPVAKEVGSYYIAKKIAKKLKFRVEDVNEVLKELGPAIFGVLLERKSIDLGNITIRSKWEPFEAPRYIRNDPEHWAFGYYAPAIDMNMRSRLLYSGKKSELFNQEFWDEIEPYLPDEIESFDDIRQFQHDIQTENSKLGKNLLVDEEGYLYLRGNQTKRRYFDENFHPTWFESMRYHAVRQKAIAEYWRRKRDGEEVGFREIVFGRLREAGFQLGRTKPDDVEGDSNAGLEEETE